MAKIARLVIASILIICLVCSLSSCTKAVQGDEDMNWQLTGGIEASFVSDGLYGYILNIAGSGSLADFASPKDAPWYSRSARVSQIVIADGITSIGSNAFAACTHVDYVVLPENCQTVSKNAFYQDTMVFSYADVAADGMKVYVYSENKPEAGGYYWHMSAQGPVTWDAVKVLFIGNSFTHTFDIDVLFGKLAEGAGVNVMVERITIGAHNLSQFADPADEGGAMVEAALTSADDYDIIILIRCPFSNCKNMGASCFENLAKRYSYPADIGRVKF